MSDNIGIKIGHDVATLDKLEGLLRLVLEGPAGDAVKLGALNAIGQAFTIEGSNISNCVFNTMEAPPREEVNIDDVF